MELNIHEAKTHFSKLLERVEQGEEVIIARSGTPIAKVIGLNPVPKKRVLGAAKGMVTFEPGWDNPMTEHELAEWGA